MWFLCGVNGVLRRQVEATFDVTDPQRRDTICKFQTPNDKVNKRLGEGDKLATLQDLSQSIKEKFTKLEIPRTVDLNEIQLLTRMRNQGKDVEKMIKDHETQIACEEKLASVLKKLNISFRITKRMADASNCVRWSDLVIPIGGDGTFLLASKLITDNRKPVFGINPSIPTRTRPISLIVQVEDQREYKCRSSGICICTGSGSQSWYKSINLQSTDTVQRIVEIATGKKLNPEETHELLCKYYERLIFHPDELQMIYIIRDLYYHSHSTMIDFGPARQLCNKVTIKSRGFDAGLIIDGSISLPFNDGTCASFEIKPEYSLRNIVLE